MHSTHAQVDLSLITNIVYAGTPLTSMYKNGVRLWERVLVVTGVSTDGVWTDQNLPTTDVYPTAFADTDNHFVLWNASGPIYGLEVPPNTGWAHYAYDVGDPYGINTGEFGAIGEGPGRQSWLNVAAPATVNTHHGTKTVGTWRASMTHPLAGQFVWAYQPVFVTGSIYIYYYASTGIY